MTSDPNLPILEEAASKLRPFLDEIVFVGGVILGLLIQDDAGAPIRATDDVDVIAQILTYPDYIAFSSRLLKSGFTEDAGEQPLACRWRNESLTLDVLPLDIKVLGYTNIWYRSALKFAEPATLPSGLVIRVVAAPFFMGTKMEAFRTRGKNDFMQSHDLEDFIAVIDGRSTIVGEIAQAPSDIRNYLAEASRKLLHEPRFMEVLPGFVYGDAASQQRVPIINQRLKEISALK